jgi:peptidoglycan/LPS O-acetylase OafA/YrhL
LLAAYEQPKAHFLPLDSIRGTAALVVLIHHVAISATFHNVFGNMGPVDQPFFHNGWIFVDLFFVLSGMVIAFNYPMPPVGRFRFGDFMIRRLARIYPLHLATLCAFLLFRLARLSLVAAGLMPPTAIAGEGNDLYAFSMNLLLLHSVGFTDRLTWNGPSWSISAEFYTYVLYGVVLLAANAVRRKLFLTICFALISILSLLLIVTVLKKPSFDFHYDFGILRCTYSFFIGVLTLRVVRFISRVQTAGLAGPLQWGSLLLAVCVVVYVGSLSNLAAIAPLLFATLLGSLMAYPDTSLSRILSTPPLLWLGQRSYSIYMTHGLVIVLTEYAIRFVDRSWFQAIDRLLFDGASASFAAMMIVATVLLLSHVTYLTVEMAGSRFVKTAFAQRLGAPVESLEVLGRKRRL